MMLKNVERDSREWDAMWGRLLALTGDPDTAMVNPEAGESWQYMGTVETPHGAVHEFRHRAHPRFNGARCAVCVRATGSAAEESAFWYPYLESPRQLADGRYIGTGVGRPMRAPRYVVEVERSCVREERDYGGAFDGFCVTSDADPGL